MIGPIAPGEEFEAVAQGFAVDLDTGDVYVRIRDNQGFDSVVRTSDGVELDLAGSGIFRVTLTAPLDDGQYTVVFDDWDGVDPEDADPGEVTFALEDLVVSSDAVAPSPSTVSSPYYVTPDELKRALSLEGFSFADDEIDLACLAASRKIDDDLDRRFYADEESNDRYFTPRAPRWIEIDDAFGEITVAVDLTGRGDFSTLDDSDVTLLPLNAAADGRPYEMVRIKSWVRSFPRCVGSVRVTATFGWEAVPTVVREAAFIMASRYLKRVREAPFGVVAVTLDGAAVRMSTTDPDVAQLLSGLSRKPLFG